LDKVGNKSIPVIVHGVFYANVIVYPYYNPYVQL
jgi:hypothetical protein